MARVWSVPYKAWAESSFLPIGSPRPAPLEHKPDANGVYWLPADHKEFVTWGPNEERPEIRWGGPIVKWSDDA